MAIFQLISFYSSPKWLLKDFESFVPLKLIMDSLQNILTYNFDTNSLLVFSLMNHSKKYLNLLELKFKDIYSEPNEIQAKTEWKPTESWFNENRAQLPIKQILSILATVSLKLEQGYLVHDATETEIIYALKRMSIIGFQEDILKFAFLHYSPNPAIETWLSSYTWKIVYLKNCFMDLFVQSKIQYFEFSQPQTNNTELENKIQKPESNKIPEKFEKAEEIKK